MSAVTFTAPPKQERASHGRPGADVLGRKAGYVVPESERKVIVTRWAGMNDFAEAPPSYEIFFRQYWSYTKWYVTQHNVNPAHLEDICMELMTRFMERDSIGVFDRKWDNRSKTGKSVFRTYYSHFLLAYTPGKKRNYARVDSRELLLFDAYVGEDSGTTWGDLNGDKATIDSDVAFHDLVSEIHTATDSNVEIVNRMIELALGSSKKLRCSDVVREFGVLQARAEEILVEFTKAVELVLCSGGGVAR